MIHTWSVLFDLLFLVTFIRANDVIIDPIREYQKILSFNNTPLRSPKRININDRYYQIFKDYVLKKIPFIQSFSDTTTTNYDDILQYLYQCEQSENKYTQDISIYDCDPLLKQKLYVPTIVTNNYLYRIVTSYKQTQDLSYIDYIHQWPSFKRLLPNQPSNILTCPSNFHQVIYPITNMTSSNGTLKIRLFHKSSHDAFQPMFQQYTSLSDQRIHIHEYHIYTKHGYDDSIVSSIKNKAISSNSGSSSNGSSNKVTKYYDITLDNNQEYIFIPNNMLVSVLYEQSNTATTDNINELYIGRHCFVDASNYQEVQASLQLLSLITTTSTTSSNSSSSSSNSSHMSSDVSSLSSVTSSPYYQLYTQLIQTNHHMKFIPSDRLLSDILEQHHKYYNIRNTGDTSSNKDNIKETSIGSISSNSDSSSNSNKNMNFKEWQEQQKWNMMMTSYTVPSPSQPIAVQTGRLNMTLEWYSTFHYTTNDMTEYGYYLDICAINNTYAHGIIYTSSKADKNKVQLIDGSVLEDIQYKELYCHNITLLYDKKTSQLTISDDNTVLSNTQSLFVNKLYGYPSIKLTSKHHQDTWIYTAIIDKNILSNTTYVLRTSLLYNDRLSLPSSWSSLIRTQPYSVPLSVPSLQYVRNLIKIPTTVSMNENTQSQFSSSSNKKIKIGSSKGDTRKLQLQALNKEKKVISDMSQALLYAVEATYIANYATTIYLSFLKPLDHGGYPILTYHVYGRQTVCSHIPVPTPYNHTARCSKSYTLDPMSSTTSTSTSTTTTGATAVKNRFHNEHITTDWHYYDSTLVTIPLPLSDSNRDIPTSNITSLHTLKHKQVADYDIVTLEVHDLYLHTRYEFKVATCNILGCSDLSETSNMIYTDLSTTSSSSTFDSTDMEDRSTLMTSKSKQLIPTVYGYPLTTHRIYSSTRQSISTESSLTPIPNQLKNIDKTNSIISHWFIMNIVTETVSWYLTDGYYHNMDIIDQSIQRVTLSYEQLSTMKESYNKGNKIHVIPGWRCHWSFDSIIIAPYIYESSIPSLPTSSSTTTTSTTTTTTTNDSNLLAERYIYNESTEDRPYHGHIVIVTRGGEPIVQKILRVQKKGALGVIVVDDGRCTQFDQICMPGCSKEGGDGFAAHDTRLPWESVRIPAIFILKSDMDMFMSRINTLQTSRVHTEL